MSKPVKDLVTEEYKDRYGKMDSACVVSVIGLDGNASNRLRRELLAKKIRLQMVKNSLARRVFGQMGITFGDIWAGPTTIAWGGNSVAELSRTLDTTFKKNDKLKDKVKIKTAVAEGEVVPFEKALTMPTRQEAIANVLAAILGCADLMALRLAPDDPSFQDAEEIQKAAERGATLTRQLLAFSRRQVIEPQLLDLHAVVHGFESMLRRLTDNVELQLHTPGPAPLVRAEPGQIEQVLLNLVVNARDAMPDGGTIDVVAEAVELSEPAILAYPGMAAGRYARVTVRDTGVGIDPDVQRHVFEPFFSTKDPKKGTGLGLSIVYGIAKEVGGTVTFSSVSTGPIRGTTFDVLLPLAK